MQRAPLACLVIAAALPSGAYAGDLFSSIDAVASELKAPDAARRRDAVDKLDAFGADEARPLLLQATSDADADVRAHAAASIGRHHLGDAVPRLTTALGDPDARLRAAAAEALGLVLAGPGAADPSRDALRATETLERALGDGEHEVREAAVTALGRVPPTLGKRAAVALTGRLDDEAAGVRQRAAEVLGRMGEARAVVPLLARLGDPTREVRIAALDALAQLGDARTVPAMVRLLRDPAEDVRAAAVSGLGRLKARAAIAPLVDVMAHGQPEALRARAAFALGQIAARLPADEHNQAAQALVAALDHDDLVLAAKEALVRAGAPSVHALTAGLGDARLDRANVYVEILRDIGDPLATPVLLDELGRGRLSPEPLVDALGAMMRGGDKRPMVELVALLGASSSSLRRHAAEALRGSVDARATSALTQATGDSDRAVRVVVIGELGRLGAKEALPELVRALGSGDEETAAAAAHALGQLGDRRAIDPLAAALGRSERRLRREAADALARIADPTSALSLMRAVRTAAPDRRSNAIVALGGVVRRRPDGTARELLLGYAEGNDAASALAAIDALGAMGDRGAVPRLVRIVEARNDTALRQRALAALGDIDSEEAMRALVSVLGSDGDPRLRAEAAWALGKQHHADGRAQSTLTAALRASAPSVRANAAAALYRLGRAPAELLPLIDDRHPAARQNAALALGHLPAAKASLERLRARDDDRHVRAAARRALEGAAPSPASDWIALDVVDYDGAPLGDAGYRLVLPDGLARSGVTDERGVIREESVPSGACALVLDEAAAPR